MIIELPDDILTQDEAETLKSLLNIENDADFISAITRITIASLSEYKEMLLGKGMPTRADEIKQRRLFLLITHYFDNRIPTEAEVSSMFQLTSSESKSLVKNVLARFKFQLTPTITQTLRTTFDTASLDADDNVYYVYIQSDTVYEKLNEIIDLYGQGKERITAKRNCAREFKIPTDTYRFLTRYFAELQGEEDATA